jgi:signal transduction histidine kinase
MPTLQSFSTIQYCYEAAITQIPTELLLYAHIPSSLAAIGFGLYIIWSKKNLASQSLATVCLLFASWCFLNLTAWFVFVGDAITMFAWSMTDLVSLMFFFFAYRFLYTFIKSTELPPWQTFCAFIIVVPTVITTALGLNLLGFDTVNCEAIENENVVLVTYAAQFIFLLATLTLGIHEFKIASTTQKRHEIILATIGILLFLLFFFSANLIVLFLTHYTSIGYSYNYELYGLFGMPILLGFLGYLIVKFKTFNIKLIGAQALVISLWILIAALLLVVKSPTSRLVALATLILALIGGFFLMRSVKKEVRQREEIEVLAERLQAANERLKELDKMKSEFVSIASHQLRSPLTSIRGYASMLSEGTYGKIPVKANEIVGKIIDASKYMALSIEDYLNVSRIEAGNMKYEVQDFNLRDVAEQVVDDLRQAAIKKGLVLVFRSDCKKSCYTHADIGKTRQIITNLVDNAMKYTPKGTITVVAHDDPKEKKIYVVVQDTGVGMTTETLEEVFDKFVRAKNANCVNVTGTGLGLFVARKMARDMGGDVWAESEGNGKGSTFRISMPLVTKK